MDARSRPVGSSEEFLAFCGTVGLGKLAAEGDRTVLPRLRGLASDPRWRVREAVAMALQRLGAVDMQALLREMRVWANGNDYEQRAAAAALRAGAPPEPEGRGHRALDPGSDHLGPRPVGGSPYRGFPGAPEGLAYCWSVAVAASPTVDAS